MSSSSGKAYKNVVRGGLKLKGAGIKKKKKKTEEIAGRSVEDHFADFLAQRKRADAERSEALARGDKVKEDTKDDEAEVAEVEDTRTEAQKKFDAAQEKREVELIAKKASKTYRSRMEEFNQYLANLSEHHDIPRVTPGPR